MRVTWAVEGTSFLFEQCDRVAKDEEESEEECGLFLLLRKHDSQPTPTTLPDGTSCASRSELTTKECKSTQPCLC
jgi:hypothetical protein